MINRREIINDMDKRKLLSALCHGSIFFSSLVVSVAIPIVILFISDDTVVQTNAKEALNFHLNIWLYEVIAGILIWVLIGWILFPILVLVSIIMPILAILKVLSEPETTYRYPFIFRII